MKENEIKISDYNAIRLPGSQTSWYYTIIYSLSDNKEMFIHVTSEECVKDEDKIKSLVYKELQARRAISKGDSAI